MTRSSTLALAAGAFIGALGIGWFLLLDDSTPSGGAVAPGREADPALSTAAAGESALAAADEDGGARLPSGAADPSEPAGSSGRTSAASRDFEQANWVEGRVILPPRAPPDVPVSVVALGRRFESGQHHSAPVERDGRFRVAFSPDTAIGSLDIESTLLYLAEPERVRPSRPPADLVLEPLLGGRILGALTLPPGAKLHPDALEPTGVQIMLWGQPRGLDSWISRRADVGELARDSTEIRYELDGLPPGDDYYLQFFVPGAVEQDRSGLAIAAGEEKRIDLTLIVGASIAGVVLDEDREPVAEARVRASGGNWRSEETDEHGRFELVGVEPGTRTLRVSSDDHLDLEHDLGTLADGQRIEGLELELSRGIEIAGVVLRPDGAPAAGAKIAARADMSGLLLGANFDMGADVDAESAADGTFRVSGLEGDTYDLFAWIDAGPDEAAERPERGESSELSRRAPRLRGESLGVAVGTLDLRLVLDAGFELRGRVTNERGEPVERFSVFALPLEEGFWSLFGGQGHSARFASDEGRFVLEGVQEGEWIVHASALGFDGSNEVPVVLPGFEGELELVLPSRGTIAGRVVDPAGVPLSGAEVEVATGGGTSDRANSKGEFKLKRVRPGSIGLVARATGFAASAELPIELAPGASLSEIVLQVRRPARIEGEVLAGMGEIAGRTVWLSGREETSHWDQTETDESGRFAFADLAPGDYEASMQPEYPAPVLENLEELEFAQALVETASETTLAESRGGRIAVALSEGEVERVVFGAPPEHPIAVHGRISSAGEACAGALLNVNGGRVEDAGARADADGRYEIVVDGAGEYTFKVQSGTDPALSIIENRSIGAGPRVELDFDLPAGRIRGRVTSAFGDALEGVTVWSWRSGDDPHSGNESRTDDEGAYEIAGLAAGEYCVQAGFEYPVRSDDGTAWGTVAVSGVDVADDVSPTVDLVLRAAGGIEILPRQADGRMAHGWQPRLVDERGLQMRPPNSWYPVPGAIGLSRLAPGTYFVTLYDGESESDTVEVQVLPEMVTSVEIRVP